MPNSPRRTISVSFKGISLITLFIASFGTLIAIAGTPLLGEGWLALTLRGSVLSWPARTVSAASVDDRKSKNKPNGAATPAPAESVAKTGTVGAAPPSGTGPQTIDWVIDYSLTSGGSQGVTLNDSWSAGQTLVPGSVKMPGLAWNFGQPNATSLNFNNFANALVSSNGQGTTLAMPRPLGNVSFSGGGDGYNTVITASGKFFAVNHHINPGPLKCFNAITNAVCAGYPKAMNTANGFPQNSGVGYNSKVVAIGNKIYISDHSNDTTYGQVGRIFCWDTDTDSFCGQSPVAPHGAMELVNGKIFVVTSAVLGSIPGYLDCFDPANGLSRCSGFTPVNMGMNPGGTWAGNGGGVDIYGVGTKVFVANFERKLSCFDSATNAVCAGWPALPTVVSTTAAGNPRSNLFPRLNAAGTITGICVVGRQTDATCFNFDSSNPTEILMGQTAISEPSYTGTADTHVGTRVFFPGFGAGNRLGCFNWATQAPCTGVGYQANGWTTVDDGSAYGLSTDGASVFSYGDAGILYSWNPVTGQRPSTLGAASVTVNIDDFYCAADEQPAAIWDEIVVTDADLTPNVEFASIKATLIDPATGAVVFGPTEMVGENGTLDISAVPSSYRTLKLLLDMVPIGTVAWSDNVPPKATLTFSSDTPVQFCYQTTVSCNGETQAHSNTINTTLDPHSATAEVTACVPSPNLSVSKSAPSPSLIAYTESTYTITVTNNGNAPTSTATVKDGLPIGLDLLSAGGPDWSCLPGSGVSPVGTISCSFTGGTLGAGGGSSTIQVVVKPQPAYGNSTVINYVSVDPTGGTNAPNPTTCTGINAPSAGCGAPVTSNIAPTPPNTPPTAQSQSVSTAEDMQLAITLSATDNENTSLTYTVVSGPSHGSLSGSGANLTYTPAANYNGPDSFTFKANDGIVDSKIATIDINVSAVNDAPSITSTAPPTATEDTAYTYDADSTDVDGPGAVWSLVAGTNTCGGSINPVTGVFTFMPTGPVPPATCVVALKVCDSGSPEMCAPQSTTVEIAAVNDAPTASDDSYSVDEDNTLTVNAPGVLGNDADPEGGTLGTSSVTGGPNHGVINIAADGSFTYTPAANYNGPDSFTYRASDGELLSPVVTVSLTVNAVNDAPVITSTPPAGATEDFVYTYAAARTDVDGPDQIWSVLNANTCAGAAIDPVTGVYTFTPAGPVPPATCVIAIQVCDGATPGLCAQQTTTIQIAAVNDAPAINANSGVTRVQGAGASAAQIATVSDPDNAAGTLAVSVNNAASATVNGVTVSNISVNANGQVSASVAAACGASNASFALKVTDPGPGSLFATATLNVTVANETMPPVINPITNVVATLPTNSTSTSMVVNFPLPTAADNCGSVVVTTNPVSGSVFNIGNTTVAVTAVDGNGNTTTATFTVSVVYPYSGFTGRVADPPAINFWTAGNFVALTFSIGGNKGFNIFLTGSPSSQQVNCSTGLQIGPSVPANSAGLNFLGKQYQYYWLTDPSWRGTCRTFQMALNDGTVKTANFRFYN